MSFASAAIVGSEVEGYADGRLGATAQEERGDAMVMGGAADGNDGGGSSSSSAWGNVRASARSRRQFASGGRYADGEPETEPMRRGGGAEGSDVTGRSLQRKHSFAYSETSAGSPEGVKGAGSMGVGAPGSFDPLSSLWPRTATDFAFSQDCGESPAFLSQERGVSAAEAGLSRDDSSRSKPLDEAFHEGVHAGLIGDHPCEQQAGWGLDEGRRSPAAQKSAPRGSDGRRSSSSGGSSGGGGGGGDLVDGDGDVRGCGESEACGAAAEEPAGRRGEFLLQLRADGAGTGDGAAGARGSDRVGNAAASAIAAVGAEGSATAAPAAAGAGAPADDAREGRLWGGPGVEWGGGSVAEAAERLLPDDLLLEEAERDGRVSRRSRSGSSRRVMEQRGASGGKGYDASAAAAARKVSGRCGDEGVEEQDNDEEELESFDLRVVYARGRTGFQESKAFDWPGGSVVAGRYEVCGYIGKAAFSTALECRDLLRERGRDAVCLKVIKNNKDFFDQSLDEIKLLQRIKTCGDPDDHHVLHMLDFFYYEEHLVIVSELLGDNLYEFSKAVKEAGHPPYFTLPRLCKIARQCLEALAYINSLGLVHCDVKPENILLSHYGRAEVKLIDFGSSCYVTDRLTTYTQSRSYRAPEVVLGLPYGVKIDVWSLGAVVAELVTGHVLLQSESIQTMLARIQGIIGPFPPWMLEDGEEAAKYFTPEGCVYQRMDEDSYQGSSSEGSPRPSLPRRDEEEDDTSAGGGRYAIIYPKRTSLKRRLRMEDGDFLDFVTALLSVDPTRRPTATEALCRPWIVSGMSYTDDELWYPPEEGHAAEPRHRHRHGDNDGGCAEDAEGDGRGGNGASDVGDGTTTLEADDGFGGMEGDAEGGGTRSPRRQSV
ncbi:unnamed protein product [Scytosiphon promiscuus]